MNRTMIRRRSRIGRPRRLGLADWVLLAAGMLVLGAGPAAALGNSEKAGGSGGAGSGGDLEGPEEIVMAGKSIFMVGHAVYLFPGAPERVKRAGIDYQGRGAFLGLLDEAYQEKMTLPRTVSPEEIAGLKPDHVILKRAMKNRLGDPLERLGLPVTYLDLETPEQYLADIRRLGELFGRQERAEEVCGYITSVRGELREKIREKIRGKTGELPEAERPSVLVLSYSAKDGETAFSVPPEGWMQSRMVREAGGNPVWLGDEAAGGGGWTKVSLEQIARWDPEVVLVTAYRQPVSEALEKIRGSEVWQELRAVREGRLAGFPKDFYPWDQPDIRWLLGLQWTAAQVHPELFEGFEREAAAAEFYETLYGLSRETIRAEVLPRLSDGGS